MRLFQVVFLCTFSNRNSFSIKTKVVYLPNEVTALLVPILAVLKAVSTDVVLFPLFVPGLANPESGLPEELIGRYA